MTRRRLVVLSGPSAAGKTTLRRVLQRHPRLHYAVSATTRPRRPGESDGVDYHFHDRDSFGRLREAGGLIEWTEYAGNLYGTLRSEVDREIPEGDRLLLDVDVRGAEALRRQGVEAVYIFLVAPSEEERRRRLAGRRTEGASEMEERTRLARVEREAARHYDHVVVNDDVDRAAREILELIGLDVEGME